MSLREICNVNRLRWSPVVEKLVGEGIAQDVEAPAIQCEAVPVEDDAVSEEQELRRQGLSLLTLPPPSASPSESDSPYHPPASPPTDTKLITVTYNGRSERFLTTPVDPHLPAAIATLLQIPYPYILTDNHTCTYPSFSALTHNADYEVREVEPPLALSTPPQQSPRRSPSPSSSESSETSSSRETAPVKYTPCKKQKSPRSPRVQGEPLQPHAGARRRVSIGGSSTSSPTWGKDGEGKQEVVPTYKRPSSAGPPRRSSIREQTAIGMPYRSPPRDEPQIRPRSGRGRQRGSSLTPTKDPADLTAKRRDSAASSNSSKSAHASAKSTDLAKERRVSICSSTSSSPGPTPVNRAKPKRETEAAAHLRAKRSPSSSDSSSTSSEAKAGAQAERSSGERRVSPQRRQEKHKDASKKGSSSKKKTPEVRGSKADKEKRGNEQEGKIQSSGKEPSAVPRKPTQKEQVLSRSSSSSSSRSSSRESVKRSGKVDPHVGGRKSSALSSSSSSSEQAVKAASRDKRSSGFKEQSSVSKQPEEATPRKLPEQIIREGQHTARKQPVVSKRSPSSGSSSSSSSSSGQSLESPRPSLESPRQSEQGGGEWKAVKPKSQVSQSTNSRGASSSSAGPKRAPATATHASSSNSSFKHTSPVQTAAFRQCSETSSSSAVGFAVYSEESQARESPQRHPSDTSDTSSTRSAPSHGPLSKVEAPRGTNRHDALRAVHEQPLESSEASAIVDKSAQPRDKKEMTQPMVITGRSPASRPSKQMPDNFGSPSCSSDEEKGYKAEPEERRMSKESRGSKSTDHGDTKRSSLKATTTSLSRSRPTPLNTQALGLEGSPLSSPNSPKKLKWSGDIQQVNTSSDDKKKKKRDLAASTVKRALRKRGGSQFSSHSRKTKDTAGASDTSTSGISDRQRDRSDLLKACLSTLKKDPYGDDTEDEPQGRAVSQRSESIMMYTSDSSDTSDSRANVSVDKLIAALNKPAGVGGLQELIAADLAFQRVAEELREVFDAVPVDVDRVIDLLNDIECTADWAGLHAHCTALNWIQKRLTDEETAVVLHDLETREIVWLATTTELAKLVKVSPDAKKLRLTDMSWRRKCMDLEDELKAVRGYAEEMSETIGGDRILLPPLRWLSAPCVAVAVSQVLFEGRAMEEVVEEMIEEWKEVESLLKGQITSVHNLLAANAANQLSYVYGWKDVCYDYDRATVVDFDRNNQVADHDVLPVPAPKPVSKVPPPKPVPEEPRHEIEDEELPIKRLPVEEARTADTCIEELPNPKQQRGVAAQRWLKAGRNLKFAAFMWKSKPGINVEKSKAQSATSEPEVDMPSASVRFKKLWNTKQDATKTRKLTILDELVENLKVPRVCDTPELKLLLISQAMHMLYKAKNDVCPKSVKGKARNGVEVFVMTLYTMAGSDLDRMMHFTSVPEPGEELGTYTKEHTGRNVAPFREMNYSVRTAVTKEGESREFILKDSEKAWEGINKWVKTLGLLYSLCHDTYADSNVSDFSMLSSCPSYYRGLAGLPEDVHQMHDRLKPGSILHWPAPSSCARDEEVATTYVNGEAVNAFKSTGGTVFFAVKGIRRGLPLQDISQYPQEAEVLVAPFTTFRVSQPQRFLGVKSSKTKIVVLEWVNTDPLGKGFTDQVFKESQEACKVLNDLANSGVVIAREPHQGLGVAFSSNMTVMEVKSGGPAWLSDTQRFIGRRLVDCNGVRVNCLADLKRAMSVSEVVCLQFAKKNEDVSEIQKVVDEYPGPQMMYAEGGSAARLMRHEESLEQGSYNNNSVFSMGKISAGSSRNRASTQLGTPPPFE